MQLAKAFVTCKNYILLSKKNTQMQILGSQSSVPRDLNGVFWLAQKWLTLFAFVALIKNVMLLVDEMDGDLTCKDLIKLFLALSISIKTYLQSLFYHRHSQEHFFNCNITSSPHVEMLLMSMIKLLFLFFLSDRKVQCCFL